MIGLLRAALDPLRFDPPQANTLRPELLKRLRSANGMALFSVLMIAVLLPVGEVLLPGWGSLTLVASAAVFGAVPLLSRSGRPDGARLWYGLSGVAVIVLFYPLVGGPILMMFLPACMAAFSFYTVDEPAYRRALVVTSAVLATAM